MSAATKESTRGRGGLGAGSLMRRIRLSNAGNKTPRAEPLRSCAQLAIHLGAQQGDVQRVRHRVTDPRGLARSPRPQEKEAPPGRAHLGPRSQPVFRAAAAERRRRHGGAFRSRWRRRRRPCWHKAGASKLAVFSRFSTGSTNRNPEGKQLTGRDSRSSAPETSRNRGLPLSKHAHRVRSTGLRYEHRG